MLEKDQMKKALICFSIEQTLIEFGGEEALDAVNYLLTKKFHCMLIDTYNNPKMLVEVLQNLYVSSYENMLSSINEKLADFSYQQPIAEFIKKLEIPAKVK